MSESYTYQPLKYSFYTRLLDLQPAIHFDAPIVIQLQECDLITPHYFTRERYEALSYVWGSKTRDRPVYCDGKSILVTENCEAALRRLRRRHRTRRLWIDALCIDQSNTRERSSQVAYMVFVYQRASQVIVWAGEHSGAGGFKAQLLTHVINWLSSFSIDGHVKMTPLWLSPSSGLRKWCADHLAARKFRAAMEGSDWPFRIWTLQEIAFARRSVVMCGATMVPWRACNLLVNIQDQGPIIVSALGRSLMAREQLRLSMRRAIAQTTSKPVIRPTTVRPPPASIWAVLNRTSEIISQATDPRDYVYGLYSLLECADLKITEPDYEKSVPCVFEDMTLAIIRISSDLLVFIRACTSSVDGYTLPSWVGNWSKGIPNEAHHRFWGKASQPNLPAGSGNEARACSGTPYTFPEQETRGHIPLTGICIGTVTATAMTPKMVRTCEELDIDQPSEGPDVDSEIENTTADQQSSTIGFVLTTMHLEEWSAFARKHAAMSVSGLNAVHMQRNVLESLCHIFFAHYSSASADTLESLGHNFDTSLDVWADWVGTTFNTDSYDPESSFCCETTRRTNPVALLKDAKLKRQLPVIMNGDDDVLCWLDCGRLALSTKDVMAGDKMIIVAGCDLPLVIRPHDNFHKLVASAHVPYAMHGQEWEKNSSRMETFVLT